MSRQNSMGCYSVKKGKHLLKHISSLKVLTGRRNKARKDFSIDFAIK